jgi:hypothetical protein
VLGILNIVSGVMGLFGALVLMAIFGGVAGLVGAERDPDAAFVVPIIGVTGIALVVFMVATSLPAVIIVRAVQLRPWSRLAGIVLSICP